jgi:ribosomal protein L11 methyltransferase
VIRLDPGMAFGTGLHASTRLCLEALVERPPAGRSVLDLGTGSGILAIAAARLGAAQVLALDIDPVATRVAAENVAQNGVEGQVTVATGAIDAAAGPYDAIVANILAEPLVRLAPAIVGRLAPRGLVVLAGLLAAEADGVARAYTALGLREVARPREVESPTLEWAALVLQRTGEAPGRLGRARSPRGR